MIALQAKSDNLQNTPHELLLGPHQGTKCMWKQRPENRHTVFRKGGTFRVEDAEDVTPHVNGTPLDFTWKSREVSSMTECELS